MRREVPTYTTLKFDLDSLPADRPLTTQTSKTLYISALSSFSTVLGAYSSSNLANITQD